MLRYSNPVPSRKVRHTIDGIEEHIFDMNESHIVSMVRVNQVTWHTYCLWLGQLQDELEKIGVDYEIHSDHFIHEYEMDVNLARENNIYTSWIEELRTDAVVKFKTEEDNLHFMFLVSNNRNYNLVKNARRTSSRYNEKMRGMRI